MFTNLPLLREVDSSIRISLSSSYFALRDSNKWPLMSAACESPLFSLSLQKIQTMFLNHQLIQGNREAFTVWPTQPKQWLLSRCSHAIASRSQNPDSRLSVGTTFYVRDSARNLMIQSTSLSPHINASTLALPLMHLDR